MKRANKILLLGLSFFLIFSCEKKEDPLEDDLTPDLVSLVGKWRSTENLPTNRSTDFAIRLSIVDTTIKLVKDLSFCSFKDASGVIKQVTIITTDDVDRTFIPGLALIDLDFAIPAIAGSPMASQIRLDNCQIGWFSVNDDDKEDEDEDDKNRIIQLGSFYYDNLPPIIVVTTPIQALTFSDLTNDSSKIKVTSNKSVFLLHTTNSCVVPQSHSQVSSSAPTIFSIDVGQLNDPTENNGVTNCVLHFQDGAGNKVSKAFDIKVVKPTFEAEFKDLPVAVNGIHTFIFKETSPNSGRAILSAKTNFEGKISCVTHELLDCLNGPKSILGDSQKHEINLSSMGKGLNSYIFTYSPEGAPSTAWATEITFNSIKFDVDIDFSAKVQLPVNTAIGAPKYFHNIPLIDINAEADGVVSFSAPVSANANAPVKQCPAYPDVVVVKNLPVTTPQSKVSALNSTYPINEADIQMECVATFTVTAPASVAGITISDNFSFVVDKTKPTISVDAPNTSVITVPVDKASNTSVDFIISESVQVISDSCDITHNTNLLNDWRKSLNYDFFTDNTPPVVPPVTPPGGTPPVTPPVTPTPTTPPPPATPPSRCSIVFKDLVLDIDHSVEVNFNVVIKPPRLIYTGATRFNRTSGLGKFSISHSGFLFCENLDATLDTDKSCFQDYISVFADTPDTEITANMINLMADSHQYKFTLVPNPPYQPEHINEPYVATATANILAAQNPGRFSISGVPLKVGKAAVTANNVSIKAFSSHPGTVVDQASGGVCPGFDAAVLNSITSGTNDLSLEFPASQFPPSQDTMVSCKLTLTTAEIPPSSLSDMFSFTVDQTIPTITFNPNSISAGSGSKQISQPISLSEIANVSSNCLNPNNKLIPAGTSIIELDFSTQSGSTAGGIITYTCNFTGTDLAGNATAAPTVLTVKYDAPTLSFANKLSGPIDFSTSQVPFNLIITPSVNGNKITCSVEGGDCGTANGPIQANSSIFFSLSNMIPGVKSYSFKLLDSNQAIITSAILKIELKNNVDLNLKHPPIDGSSISDISKYPMTINPSKNGTLTISTPPNGSVCFNNIDNLNTALNKDELKYLNATLPPACDNRCDVKCILTFTESETGTTGKAFHSFDFTVNKKDIKLIAFPEKDKIVNVNQSSYHLTFDTVFIIDASAPAITIRDYNSNVILYSFAAANATIDATITTKLNLTIPPADKDNAISALLKSSRVYIHIPINKIKPTNNGLAFAGTGTNKSSTSFYTAVNINKLKTLGQWRITPSGNIEIYNADIFLNCDQRIDNSKFCLKNNNIATAIKIKGLITNAAPLDVNITNTSALNDKITLKHEGFSSQASSYYLSYDYTLLADEKIGDNLDKRLLTNNNVIIVGDTGTSLSLNYSFQGIVKMLGSGKQATAAYGLRKLNSSYNGNLIDIVKLNGANKQYSSGDIRAIGSFPAGSTDSAGKSVEGQLNTTSVTSFASGSDFLGVYKWYDQVASHHLKQGRGQTDSNSQTYKYTNLPIIFIKGVGSRSKFTGPIPKVKGSNKPVMVFPGRYSNTTGLTTYKYPMLITERRALRDMLGTSSNNTDMGGTVFMVVLRNHNRDSVYTWGFSSRDLQLAASIGRSSMKIYGGIDNSRSDIVNTTHSNTQSRNPYIILDYLDGTNELLNLLVSKMSINSNRKLASTWYLWKRQRATDWNLLKYQNKESNSTTGNANSGDAHLSIGRRFIHDYNQSKPTGGLSHYNYFSNEVSGEKVTAIAELIFFAAPLSDQDIKAIAREQAEYFFK
ncbi:MAG: hypothetical protein JJV97_01185 [SAR324 cluster bacterium]|nr:hypothetical protein [SAR324 cluster bacterium]